MSLDSLEVGHSFTVRPEYRAFAERARGVRLADAPVKVGKGLEWVTDIAEVFTLEELAREYAELRSWNARLLRFAYPIARTYAGDAIVQVTSGKYAGQILWINHETFHGFVDVLASLAPSREQEEFLATAGAALEKLGFVPNFVTADPLIGLLVSPEFDVGGLIAGSFAEFLAALESARALVFETREAPSTPRLAFKKIADGIDARSATPLGGLLVLGGRTGSTSAPTPRR